MNTSSIATKHDIQMLQDRIVRLETVYHMVTTIEAIWGRIEKLEQLVTIQGAQIGRLEERMDRLEERMDRLEERMDRLGERMDRLEANVSKLAANIEKIMEFLKIKPAN